MLFNYLGFASGLLPIVAALINYRNLNYTLKLAASFFLIAFIVDFISWLYLMRFINITNNQPFFHLSIVITIIFYGIIYYRSFYKIQLKYFTLILSIIALITVIYFTIKDGIWVYPSWGNTCLSFYMIIISLLYFYQMLDKQEFIHIEEHPLFWISSGILVYSSFNIFLYMLFSKLNYPPNLYIIHIAANIMANLLFTIGLLWKTQKIT